MNVYWGKYYNNAECVIWNAELFSFCRGEFVVLSIENDLNFAVSLNGAKL